MSLHRQTVLHGPEVKSQVHPHWSQIEAWGMAEGKKSYRGGLTEQRRTREGRARTPSPSLLSAQQSSPTSSLRTDHILLLCGEKKTRSWGGAELRPDQALKERARRVKGTSHPTEVSTPGARLTLGSLGKNTGPMRMSFLDQPALILWTGSGTPSQIPSNLSLSHDSSGSLLSELGCPITQPLP